MINHSIRCRSGKRISLGLAVFFILTGPAYAQTGRQLTDETAKLQKIVATLPIESDESRSLVAQLDEVNAAVAAGYNYLGIYRLQVSWIELLAQKYRADRSEVEKKGMDAFEDDWRRLGDDLSTKEQALAKVDLLKAPAVAVALAQASQNQVRPYYQSGRLYGMNTTIGDGLYYLGRAPANLDFALFALQMTFARPGRHRQFSSFDAALASLERETLQSYRAPGASKRQAEFNNLNSKLKMAGELNKAGFYEGALQKLLEGSLVLGRINAPPGAADIKSLQEKSRAIGRDLKQSKFDESIGLLFWEMAERLLGKADVESVRAAQVIIESVLPQYQKYIAELK